MTWMQVPGDKLLEPVVNLVIKHFHLTAAFPFSSIHARLFGDLHCTDPLAARKSASCNMLIVLSFSMSDSYGVSVRCFCPYLKRNRSLHRLKKNSEIVWEKYYYSKQGRLWTPPNLFSLFALSCVNNSPFCFLTSIALFTINLAQLRYNKMYNGRQK